MNFILKNTILKKCFLLLSVSMTVSLSGCKDGAPGPKGPAGEAGLAGVKGPTGIYYYKGGFINGRVIGIGIDGVTEFDELLNLEFNYNTQPAFFSESASGYQFTLSRTDSAGNSRMYLQFSTAQDFSSANFNYGSLTLVKKVGSNEIKTLEGSVINNSDNYENVVTNLNYNATTGVLTGDYNWMADPASRMVRSSTKQPFMVQGSFSIICRKGNY